MHRLMAARRQGGRTRDVLREDWTVMVGRQSRVIRAVDSDSAVEIELVGEGRRHRLAEVDWRPGRALFRASLDGAPFTATVRTAADGYVVRHRAAEARVRVLTPEIAELYARLPERAPADTSRQVLSPMPGLVVSIDVLAGQEVKAGEAVAVIEAMKMQNIIKVERDGVVKTVGVKAGDSVAADEVLIELG